MQDKTTDLLNIDGVSLEYRWFDPADERVGDAPTLVLLHEGLGCVAMWKDWPQALADQTGCPVFVYSRAGYGGSDPVPLPRPLTYMHHEGENVLSPVFDASEIEKCVLVGHSDGGSIALINAGHMQDPRVQALALMAPHVFNEQVCVDSIRQARVAFETGKLREGLARYHGDNVDVAFRGWNDAWLDPGFWHWNLEEYLPSVHIPVLLMQGRQDEYGTAAQIAAIERRITGPATVRWLDDCGHSPHRDQPQASIEAIHSFLVAHSLVRSQSEQQQALKQ